MTRILSGVQPTGNLHLGNYLGAIKNWVEMQHEHESLFCIVDLHAITVPQDPKELRESTLATAAAYIACGIDPEKSTIFHQSAVPEHAELAWLFSTMTPMGWLNRMTQFKEKRVRLKNLINSSLEAGVRGGALGNSLSDRSESIPDKIDKSGILKPFQEMNIFVKQMNDEQQAFEQANLGLYAYPVLMAADILIYKATHVPVGEDQKQHLELARDIAGAFNRQYKKQTKKPHFRLPAPLITGAATRVMSLRDGTSKMSKSEESDYSRVNLTDSADLIAKKIKKAKSDMEPGISYDVEKRPEVSNLLNIFAAVSGEKRADIEARFEGSGMADFKGALADAIISHIEPISQKIAELKGDQAYLEELLSRGVGRARAIAGENIAQIKNIMGFLQG